MSGLSRVCQTVGDLVALFGAAKRMLPEVGAIKVSMTPVKMVRSIEQNKRMWAMLDDIARQIEWHGQRLNREDWKDLLTASYRRQRFVPGIPTGTDPTPGIVALGTRTSKMSVDEMSEFMELIASFGVEHGVVFGD